MSESVSQRQKSSGTDATEYPQLLDRQVFDSIPQSWLDAGRDAEVGPNERCLVASDCYYERTLHRHGRTSTTADLVEHEELIVRYRNPETGDTRMRTYLASKQGDGIVPKCFRTRSPQLFQASIAHPYSEDDM